MRYAAIPLVLATAALGACAQPEQEGASAEGPVVESEVTPVSPADDEQLEAGERSLADPAPGSVTAPAGEANPPTLAPDAGDDPDAVSEQYPDGVSGEQD